MRRWQRWLPGLQILRDYKTAWLPHDVMAGLVLTTMLVPVGIAYALASGVPGIYGLYATIVPLLAYALFGPSRILVLGPDSSLAPVILAVVLPLSGGDGVGAVVSSADTFGMMNPADASAPCKSVQPIQTAVSARIMPAESSATGRAPRARPLTWASGDDVEKGTSLPRVAVRRVGMVGTLP
jgi:MFS superfamily sulfate permease-like transporter